MIKIAVKACFFLLLIVNNHPLFADFQSSVEIRSAAFFHSSQRFREIYGNVGASYQLEASTKLYNNLDEWVNLEREVYSLYWHRAESLKNMVKKQISMQP